MDEAGQGSGGKGALALWWRATWANLLAILVCLVWFCVVQASGLVKLIDWVFTLPGRILFERGMFRWRGRGTPIPDASEISSPPPVERRRRIG